MNLHLWKRNAAAPARRAPVKRPRLRCSHCGFQVPVISGLSGEEIMRRMLVGEVIPLQRHTCSYSLDDTAELGRKLTAEPPRG